MNWTLESLTGAIHQWGRERGIHQNGNLVTQSQKLVEEAQETLAAASRFVAATNLNLYDHKFGSTEEVLDEYSAAYKEFADGIGDTFVVLVQLCAIAGIELEECVDNAYQEIRDRRGYLNEDGVFVKENR